MTFRMRRTQVHRGLIFAGIVAGFLLLGGCTEKWYDEKGTMQDPRDGRNYEWIRLGRQTWMAENLAYLPEVSPSSVGSDTLPYYYVYNYNGTDVNSARSAVYFDRVGVFYNWTAAMNGGESTDNNPSGVRGICPEGWHLPSDPEWDELVVYLNGEYIAGKTMKSTNGWNDFRKMTGKGDNSSGFNGYPGGARKSGGGFYKLGYHALYWSATEYNEHNAWYRNLGYYHDGVYRYFTGKECGFSVRCVRDN